MAWSGELFSLLLNPLDAEPPCPEVRPPMRFTVSAGKPFSKLSRRPRGQCSSRCLLAEAGTCCVLDTMYVRTTGRPEDSRTQRRMGAEDRRTEGLEASTVSPSHMQDRSTVLHLRPRACRLQQYLAYPVGSSILYNPDIHLSNPPTISPWTCLTGPQGTRLTCPPLSLSDRGEGIKTVRVLWVPLEWPGGVVKIPLFWIEANRPDRPTTDPSHALALLRRM